MSNARKTKARLRGWKGPFFPEGVDRLQVVYSERGVPRNGSVLEGVGARLGGYIKQTRPSTNDGYRWFWGLVFDRSEKKKLAVLFPWAQDWENHDRTQTDRSIAVYTQGEVEEEVSALLMESLASTMSEVDQAWRRRSQDATVGEC